MVENIKITARELKRQLKISIYLPKNYNNTEKDYPLIYALDGQMMFHALDNDKQIFDLSEILDDFESECICIGIHAPKIEEWRISELCPYYIKDDSQIDPSLAVVFSDYIANILHPLLKERYRINNNVYLLGFDEGAIFNIYSIYRYEVFKGAGIFSPKLDICENVLEDIVDNYDPDKKIYLYHGGKGGDSNLFYSLYSLFESLRCDQLKLIYEEQEDNSPESWKKHILEYLRFIL